MKKHILRGLPVLGVTAVFGSVIVWLAVRMWREVPPEIRDLWVHDVHPLDIVSIVLFCGGCIAALLGIRKVLDYSGVRIKAKIQAQVDHYFSFLD